MTKAVSEPRPQESDQEFLTRLQAKLEVLLEDARLIAPRRIRASTEAKHGTEVLQALRNEFGGRHLSAISGVDTGDDFEVVYHVSAHHGLLISLHIALPRSRPVTASVTDVYPSAVLYEREVHDLFGIEFTGHPDLRRLLLYEGWPEGQYPLRKDWERDQEGEGGA